MEKIIYSKLDGNISIVTPASIASIEKVLGSLTQQEYEDHVYSRSVPNGAINPRLISLADLPVSREFRNAWCDVTEENRVDISCEKARDLKLEELRTSRNEKLDELDKTYQMMSETGQDLTAIKAEKQALRDITDPLKSLVVAGIVNDEILLQSIRDLSVL